MLLARARLGTSLTKRSAESSTLYIGGSNVKIAIVDGIAEVQLLD